MASRSRTSDPNHRDSGPTSKANNPLQLHLFAALLLTLLIPACGSQVIPRAAVEGTTVAVFLPGQFQVGFGLTGATGTYDPSSDAEDPQRGELIFSLWTLDPVTPLSVLKTKYVTALNLSPSSRSALEVGGSNVFSSSQHVAFVEIPNDIVPAGTTYRDLTLKVTLQRRTDQQSTGWDDLGSLGGDVNRIWYQGVEQRWLGWADWDSNPATLTVGSPNGIAIRVYRSDEPDLFADFVGWDMGLNNLNIEDIEGELEDLVPYPSFVFDVPKLGETPQPSSWEAEVRFPSKRLTIEGVTVRSRNPSNSIVGWEVTNDANSECDTRDASLQIQLLDPGLAAEGVRVSYSLDNFIECGRAQHANFDVESLSAYDENGQSVSVLHEILASSFY